MSPITRARQKASRNPVILRLSRLGWPQEKISETVGLSRGRITQIVSNANFGDIDTLLAQGHDMEYIARHYNMDLRQCRWRAGWALRLEGKTDQEKLKELAFCPDLIFSRNQGKPAKIGLARFAS